MENSLYTFIFDYLGGTYISQVEAPDEVQALLSWGQNLDTEPIARMGKRTKKRMLEEISDDAPTALDEVKNVWYVSFILKHKLASVHIIRTVQD
jgi:hypothetical protein